MALSTDTLDFFPPSFFLFRKRQKERERAPIFIKREMAAAATALMVAWTTN